MDPRHGAASEQDWTQPRRTRPTATESVIDEYSSFNGTYRTTQNLRVEGRYEGEIECEGTVTITEQAQVNGQIRAENVTVAGRFEGEIDCAGRFELLSTGRVRGRVTAGIITVHEGSAFDGQLARANAHLQGAVFASPREELENSNETRTSGPLSVNRRREAG